MMSEGDQVRLDLMLEKYTKRKSNTGNDHSISQ